MSFAGTFNEMKRIYGFCPCCGELFRLSEVSLFTRAKPPRTVFYQVNAQLARLELLEQSFRDEEDQVRDDARRKGQADARRRLRTIAPFFTQRKIELRDVKVLFHPVEYVVFRGMSGSNCLSVDFVDHPADSSARERIQASLQRAIDRRRIDWQTFRITDEGRVIVEGSSVKNRVEG
jgi:predicted Holliday junction resolvase-like endonuclease